MNSNSEQSIDLPSIIEMDQLKTTFSTNMPDHLNTTSYRANKGVVRKIIHNQKTFLELFNKYQCEVRNLQVTIENKFKKVNVLETRLLDLARMMHNSTNSYLIKKQHNQKLMNKLNKFNSVLNTSFYNHEQSSPEHSEETSFNTITNAYNQYSPLFEPIIDIHVSEEEYGTTNNENDTKSEQSQAVPISTIVSESKSENVNFFLQEECSNSSGSNKNGGRKVSLTISTKTQFMQLVDRCRKCNNLAKEKITENVMALRAKESDTVLGYQCSVDGCSYMHFLRAQVNRHFKNYHSKTCNHCNQRFKRPIDLLIHLNENKISHANINNNNNNNENSSSSAILHITSAIAPNEQETNKTNEQLLLL